MKIRVTTFLFLVFFKLTVYALEPGQEAPYLDISKWIVNGPVSLRSGDRDGQEHFYVMEFWASWSPTCDKLVPILNFLLDKYGASRVSVVAVSKEKEAAVREFLGKHPDIKYAVALDNKGATSRAYMETEAIIPQVFIVNGNRRILWRGDGMDLARGLEKIISGKFDLEKQKKISALYKDLDAALRAGLIREVLMKAECILELDPRDGFAMRACLFAYDRNGENDKAIAFLDDIVKRCPDYSQAYFIKLELMIDAGRGKKELVSWIRQIYEKFKADPEIMNELAGIINTSMPFGIAPLGLAVDSAERAVKTLTIADPPAKRAVFYGNLARAYYLAGAFDKAIDTQRKVSYLLSDPKEKKIADEILDFFKEAVKLQRKINSSPNP